jgi:hypothetical protein
MRNKKSAISGHYRNYPYHEPHFFSMIEKSTINYLQNIQKNDILRYYFSKRSGKETRVSWQRCAKFAVKNQWRDIASVMQITGLHDDGSRISRKYVPW